MGMVDISCKESVVRVAVAEGRISLKKKTTEAIRKKETKKGDVLYASELAGINAVKRTPETLAYCHQIPIEKIDVEFDIKDDHIMSRVTVKATAKTGVEMEALVGVSAALNNVWDMVKYLEKDKDGQYPDTKISDIRILKKEKGNKDVQ